ncbi:bifunctional metallophosphatase/5'-nucleotidase [Paenibacillus sp. GCM10027629]|uniref:bifunctional metallophosphatase/5'-nucleotidase n=1 Tax=Paenibacillus sp. GCM10027629 TaxID=3273414 RepID=UPI00362990C5
MDKERRSFVLFHSNDIHSHLEQAAKIATVIDLEREKRASDEMLILDIGDHMDRMRVETEGSIGAVNVHILNHIGYEAIVLGNNEGLTYTPEQMEQVYTDQATFRIIGSNIREMASGEVPAWMVPYEILHKGDLRIGLIGVTAAFTDFYELLGWHVLQPYDVIAELTAELRQQVDVLIVMSHLGIKHDRAIAERIPGIDLILGGHTHHLFEEAEKIGDTYICAAGKFGSHLGRIELEFNSDSRRYDVTRAVAISLEEVPPDPGILSIIDQYGAIARQNLSKVVARLDHMLTISEEKESPLANLLAAALKAWTGAGIGLTNTGQLLDALEAGDITLEMLHRICPSPINPCVLNLTGAQLLQSLEESLLPEFQQRAIRGFGFRGRVLGTIAVDGLEIYYDVEQPPYERIQEVIVTGTGDRLQKEEVYQVATLDMFTFGVGYMALKEGIDRRYYLPEFIRDLLAWALCQESLLSTCPTEHWHLLK